MAYSVYVRLLLFAASVLILSLVAQNVVLGGASVIKLERSQPLYGSVSQALSISSSDNMPVPIKDFSLSDTQNFLDDTWLVARVISGDRRDDAVVVMKKDRGVYQVVLGPGSAFPSGYTLSLPGDVSQYLIDQGYIYESTAE